MTTKLTIEEFRPIYFDTIVSPELLEEFRSVFKMDLDKEVQRVLQDEYDKYLELGEEEYKKLWEKY